MKSLIEVNQGAINFDIDNSMAPLLGFRKIVYKQGCLYRKLLILWVLVLLTFTVM